MEPTRAGKRVRSQPVPFDPTSDKAQKTAKTASIIRQSSDGELSARLNEIYDRLQEFWDHEDRMYFPFDRILAIQTKLDLALSHLKHGEKVGPWIDELAAVLDNPERSVSMLEGLCTAILEDMVPAAERTVMADALCKDVIGLTPADLIKENEGIREVRELDTQIRQMRTMVYGVQG